jgi:glucose/arabinose dehydrogenase/mono/diheme cytochrome c family protein
MRINLFIIRSFLILLNFILLAGCGKSGKNVILPDRGNGGIKLPENFGAVVVVDTLGRGRHLAVNENGDVYVHLRRLNHEGNGIVAMRDSNGDGIADMLAGYSAVTGTGIKIHKGYLYYSDQTHVYRSRMTPGELMPATERDTIATLVDGVGHMEKTFTFDNQGNLYVNVGSKSNCCEEPLRTPNSRGPDPCIELETRAGIWMFDDSEAGQIQRLDLRYATGIRNAVALTWNSDIGRLFALQHGRDDLHRYWPDLFTEEENLELPSEIFFDLEKGDDMGWPYCYYDHIRGLKLLNPEYGGDGEMGERCANAKTPLLGFPGHWGPNDVLFYQGDLFPEKYKHGAFVAFHGSWNRLNHEQQGFNVIFIPMKEGKPSGNWEVFAEGFTGPAPVTNPNKAFFRPCGLAEGPDGSLYICDSQHGRVWRVLYYKDGIPQYIDRRLYQPVDEEALSQAGTVSGPGKEVYTMYCQQCHMDNGRGAPGMNPPLVGTKMVNGDKSELIKIILNGFSQPVEIDGERYQNIMASHAFLSDQQIADVLTFIRNNWGNSSGPVTRDEVAKVRAAN